MAFPNQPKTISLTSNFDQALANTAILALLLMGTYFARRAMDFPPNSTNRHIGTVLAGFLISCSLIMMALPHIERELGVLVGATPPPILSKFALQ